MKWSNVKMAMLLRVSARLALMLIVKATTISKSILDSIAVMSSDNHARIQFTDLYKSCLRVCVCHGQEFFFEFIVGLNRVAQDKHFGVGMTLLRPRVCLLETI